MLQKVRIFQENRCSDATKFHVHATCFPHVARLKGTGVCGKKKPKTFSTVFGFVRPRPPKAQSWQAQQQTALQDVAFFSQLVALMSAAASTLNLGGEGGEQQH